MNLSTQRYSQDLRKYYRLPAVQVSLALVLSVFVMAIFITFALRPTILSIVTLQKTIEESKKTLTQLDAKVKSLQVASTQLEELKPSLSVINASIPNEGALYSPLTQALESLAIQSGVKIESESLGPTLLFSRILSPFKPDKKQSVVALTFTARVTGDYPAINVFLKSLLTMERIVSLETATITREAGNKSTSAGVSLNLSGQAYYLADSAQLEKAIQEKKGGK